MPEDGFSINVRQSVCRWLIQRAAQCSFQQTAAFWRRETVLHCWAVQSGTCRLTEVSTFYLFLTQWGKDSCISGVSQCPFDLGLLQLLVLSLSTNCQWQGLEIRKPPLCRDGANLDIKWKSVGKSIYRTAGSWYHTFLTYPKRQFENCDPINREKITVF